VYIARKKNQCHTILELISSATAVIPAPAWSQLCLRRRAAEPVWRGSGATTKTRVPETLLALGLGFSPLQASLLGPPRAM